MENMYETYNVNSRLFGVHLIFFFLKMFKVWCSGLKTLVLFASASERTTFFPS